MGDAAYDADVASGGDEYCPYEEGLLTGTWTTRDYQEIKLPDMTLQHLHGALRVAQRAKERATFSNVEEMWQSWIELLEDEIFIRERRESRTAPVQQKNATPSPVRGETVQMICHCGTEYAARKADIKRGWGFSCSKRCAAIRRDFGAQKQKRKVVKHEP